jgi:hypothetical protein
MNEQLSINLTSDISYVYGLVNGAEATFTLTGPGIWSATVPKSTDGRYVIAITAYNNLGTPTNYNTTIYRLDDIITPKRNWTADDYYNDDDLNRVEANTQYIAEYLKDMDYLMPKLTIKTDRDMRSIDFISSINRVENNLDEVKNNFITPIGWQNKKIWSLGKGFDFTDANRLENNLYLLYSLAKIAKENIIYSGTFNCGTDWEGGLYG